MRTKTDKREIEYVQLSTLTPYARNSRTHTPLQVKQIAASIKEFGFTNPVLVDGDGTIIAGHGRVLAAEHLQMTEVPCIRLSYLTEAQKRAYVIADNKLAINAGWDEELLNLELNDLHKTGFDLSVIGFSADELSTLMGLDDVKKIGDDEENPYSQKVDIPTYEPSGEMPNTEQLYDQAKTNELIQQVNNSTLSNDEKQFLIAAASRHIVFDYASIANYYAHASKQCQELMENSALVIIDYGKAIEQGLVKLTKQIDEMFGTQDDEE
jgi:ParB-like chromosome segregation protein Spo0J